MKTAKELIQKRITHVILLLLVSFITFAPTLKMHFYLDDWAGIYDLLHGKIQLDWPPRLYTYFFNNILLSIFGINPLGYFSVGLTFFVLSVIVFYFFVSKLSQNKTIGLISALVYATTPVGTDTVFMVWTYVLEGGYPLNLFLFVLLLLLLKYFRERKIIYVVIALLGFTYLLEVQPRRAFLLFPVIFLFDYFVNFKKVIPSTQFFLRQILFITAIIAFYKFNFTLTGIFHFGDTGIFDATSYDWRTKLELGLSSLTHVKPLITVANILLGAPLLFLSQSANLISFKMGSFWAFIVLFIAVVNIFIAFKVKKEWGFFLLFALGWIYSNVLGIYVFSSPGVSPTTGRTMSLSAPAYALFITICGFSLFNFLKKRKFIYFKRLKGLFILILIAFLLVNYLSTNLNFERFNELRSRPTHAFFNSLKNNLPSIPKGAVIYLKSSDNPHIKNRLGKIYGDPVYAGHASIASFYDNLAWDEFEIVYDFHKVKEIVEKDEAKINKVFAFYYNEDGLTYITDIVRRELHLD